ncbi:Coiled-coil domain-containing protein 6 [Toxocara canis]|uniref:Coiled-coil domain-containing protein 6 n=1 Tax=Toxocara canis TaxID=6265 RepID=A0A0B2UNK2_TOXCA|nr:Coiled-coil domain-containing protein 6 [Toxocara canis]
MQQVLTRMSGGTSPSVDSSSNPSSSCHGDQRHAAGEGQRSKHTRRPRASRDEVERPGSLTSPSAFLPSQGSPQMSESMSDVISDAKLISLNEGRTPRTSVDYDQLLSKAVALLKEKNERDEEIVTLRARNESLLQLNRTIREKSVRLHAKAEQEEEFISNMLLKRIQKLKNDKEAIALKYEQEEEFLTNDLTRKLSQLQNERDELAGRAKAEQSCVVDTLLVKIRKLEAEINANHVALEQLRREKVDLENALEHEQEQLFNTLGKRMDQLEAEKRRMQARLDQASVSEDQSPASSNSEVFACSHEDSGERRSSRAEIEARKLREECSRLRTVIASQKSTISNLQQQMNAQETKCTSCACLFCDIKVALHCYRDSGERRSSRAEIEARKLREECSRLRTVIASQKSTISNLQQQMNAQETKCTSCACLFCDIKVALHCYRDSGERRSSRAEIEARKLREECSRLRTVIASQKSTISNLQQQMNAQETKYVAGLLAMREKSAETRADIRRARVSLEADLSRCLDICRAFAASQAVREGEEDKRMDVLLSHLSIPKSTTPVPIQNTANPSITTLSSTETDASWHDERPLSARSESQGDRMEEGSEAADTDGDTQMDSNFFSCENVPPQSDELGRFSDDQAKLINSYASSISAASNEDSNESTESVNAAVGQFARPALPPNRSPVAKKEY